MTVDDSLLHHFKDAQAANDQTRRRLEVGGGDGQPPGMDTEVALLKQRADQADQRLERIEGKLDRIVEVLGTVSTKGDVREAKRAAWQGLGVGAAIAVAVVGLFVAVLAYLQDQRIATRAEPAAAAPPAQVILQLPPWPTAPSAPPSPAN